MKLPTYVESFNKVMNRLKSEDNLQPSDILSRDMYAYQQKLQQRAGVVIGHYRDCYKGAEEHLPAFVVFMESRMLKTVDDHCFAVQMNPEEFLSTTEAVWVFCGSWHVEVEGCFENYHLQLDRGEYDSKDLYPLAYRLFDWALKSGELEGTLRW